ncbi:MAG: FRG domain-containing protein [Phycisphaerae bacterium]|nr:FRG domain-containing protein [Phycisphaerae bacterium]
MKTHQIGMRCWSDFVIQVRSFSRSRGPSEQAVLFRGHADAAWPLQSTLDRFVQKQCPTRDRESVRAELIFSFKQLARGLNSRLPGFDQALAWELLARHHGVPSAILDWSRSAYVAAYFAFSDAECLGDEKGKVAIWMLDRTRLGGFRDAYFGARFSDEDEREEEFAVRWNSRAIEQQAVSMTVERWQEPIETAFSPGLTKFVIPRSEAFGALYDLRMMSVCARSLFRDLGGAATTAQLEFLTRDTDR